MTEQVRRVGPSLQPPRPRDPEQKAGGNNGSQEVQAVGCPPGPHPGLTLHFQLAPLTLAVADFWSCLYKLRRRFQGVAPTWEEASLRSPVERWWSLIAHSNKRQPRPRRTGPSGG